MKAMILAAGHGKRMRPLTNEMPKPLLPVGGRPLIIWHILNLKAAGIDDIVINLGWKGFRLPEILGDGSLWDVNLHYSDEQATGPLETAGGIRKALPLLGEEPFIVVNGDIWCDFPYRQLNLQDTDLAQLVLVNNPEHNPNGDFGITDSRVTEDGAQKYTFSGIGCYRQGLFTELEIDQSAALAPLLRLAMRKDMVGGEVFNGDWRDVGTPERLQELDQGLLAKA